MHPIHHRFTQLASRFPIKDQRVQYLFLIFGMLFLPFLVRDQYALKICIDIGIYIILALGLNIVVGLSGLLALGFAAFYGIGAYTLAILNLNFGASFWLILPIGTLLAGFFGILLGIPTLRMRGDYLAIVTLGFGEIVRIVFANWISLTRGPMGMPGISPPTLGTFTFGVTPLRLLGQSLHPLAAYYFLIALLALLAILILDRLSHSRIGRAWMALREDETAAKTMGINTVRLKILAFALSAFFAGAAGVYFAGLQTFVGPNSFTFLESVLILCMVVMGGRGSILGVSLGAIALIALPELLRQFLEYRMLIFGAIMVFVILFRPQGLMGSKY